MSARYLEWSVGELGPDWLGILRLELVEGGDGVTALRVHLSQDLTGPLPQPGLELLPVGRGVGDLAHEVDWDPAEPSIVVVRFPWVPAGYATYRVRLVGGVGPPTHSLIHPWYAERTFAFDPSCHRGDCRGQAAIAPEEVGPWPPVDMRTKDFRGFIEMLSEWVRVHNPHWSDLSPASLERVLLELLAHHADLLSYYQDRVANEAFIETASQRHSLRQHGVLLGCELFDGRRASTMLAFEVPSSGFVPAGLQVRARGAAEEVPVIFTVRDRTRVEAANNSAVLRPAAWPGAWAATLPEGATELLLWGQEIQLAPGMDLVLVQGPFHQLVRLTEVVRRDDLPGWVESPDAAATTDAHRLTLIRFEPALTRALTPFDRASPLRLYANLVPADQGRPRRAWVNPLSRPAPTDLVLTLDTRNSIRAAEPVEEGTPRRLLRALQVPEGPVLFEDRGGRGCPVLELLVDAQPWSQVEHLSGSQSFDTHYVAGADEDGRLWLQFGDGVHGREVPLDPVSGAPEVELELRYAVGDPLAGNCARDTLTEALAPTPGSADEDAWRALGTPVQVTNCIPGSGGQAPEPKEAARLRIPASLRHGPLQRAVSLEDYATLAKGLPEVARATARAIDGPFNGVEVLVDPEQRAGLDEPLRGRVQAALEAGRMAARETWVVGPTYVPLEVELSVCPEPGQLPHRLRDRVDAALRPGSSERPGFFHPDRLSFGQDLRLSELLAVVQGLPGVRSVKALRCRRQGSVDDPRVMDRIVLAGTEVARLDADPEVPEHGTLVVRVVGMEAEPIADYRVQTAAGADT